MVADLGLRRGNILVPVGVVVGSEDRVEDPDRLGKIFGELVPQARVEVLPRIGHLSPLEAPDAIAAGCREMLAKKAPS